MGWKPEVTELGIEEGLDLNKMDTLPQVKEKKERLDNRQMVKDTLINMVRHIQDLSIHFWKF